LPRHLLPKDSADVSAAAATEASPLAAANQ
jgi:hypothetical protein